MLPRWKKSVAPVTPTEPKPSPVAKYKESIATLEEENFRMRREIERGGGDLLSPKDTNRNIAKVMLPKFGLTRLRGIVAEAAKLRRKAEKEAAAGTPPLRARERRSDDTRRRPP